MFKSLYPDTSWVDWFHLDINIDQGIEWIKNEDVATNKNWVFFHIVIG